MSDGRKRRFEGGERGDEIGSGKGSGRKRGEGEMGIEGESGTSQATGEMWGERFEQ